MKRLVGLALALSVVVAVPSFAADPPYKIPPGQYCKGMSKKKIAGQKKTPFAQCTSALGKLQKNQDLVPSQVCAGLKKAKGKKAKKTGAAQFKKCVSAGKKYKLDLANANAAANPPYKVPPGQYCKGLSKKKLPGQKKTPFAQCTSAMAKVDKGTSPKSACAGLAKGAKGKGPKATAKKNASKCTTAGKKLNADKKAANAA